MAAVWGALAIQTAGAAAYWIGRLLSAERASLTIDWLNIMGLAFMPVSLLTGCLSLLVFHRGWLAPYPNGVWHGVLFVPAFAAGRRHKPPLPEKKAARRLSPNREKYGMMDPFGRRMRRAAHAPRAGELGGGFT